MKLGALGDTHGSFHALETLIKQNPCDVYIHVGDFGFEGRHYIPDEFPIDLRILQGNHDNPDKLFNHKHFVQNGSSFTLGDHSVFCLGGAESYLRPPTPFGCHTRYENEECSQEDLDKYLQYYMDIKPDVLITHTPPHYPYFSELFPRFRHKIVSRTAYAIGAMLRYHKPKYHIFGHMHESVCRTIDGVTFVCIKKNGISLFTL